MTIDRPYLTKWIADHDALVIEPSDSKEFHDYLLTFPWLPSKIDWRAIRHISFCMDDYAGDDWEEQLVEFSNQTLIGSSPKIMVMFNGEENAFIASRNAVLRDIDLIYSGSPGARYFCGADLAGTTVLPNYQSFAEYDGDARLTFRVEQD